MPAGPIQNPSNEGTDPGSKSGNKPRCGAEFARESTNLRLSTLLSRTMKHRDNPRLLAEGHFQELPPDLQPHGEPSFERTGQIPPGIAPRCALSRRMSRANSESSESCGAPIRPLRQGPKEKALATARGNSGASSFRKLHGGLNRNGPFERVPWPEDMRQPATDNSR